MSGKFNNFVIFDTEQINRAKHLTIPGGAVQCGDELAFCHAKKTFLLSNWVGFLCKFFNQCVMAIAKTSIVLAVILAINEVSF